MEYGIIGCSGGPDSMALLDMLVSKQDKVYVVAHVNYQKRETAKRDEDIVKRYCEKHNLCMHVLKPEYDGNTNFQAWARLVRYEFFESLANQYHTKDVYVAHHKDDVIETYLFQKNRNMICDWYGMKARLIRKDICVHRPLLSFDKQELMEYCESHTIEYGIDESNLEDDYTRNQIRHSQVEHMTKEEKDSLLHEIEGENQKLTSRKQQASLFLENWDLQVDSLLSKQDNWFILESYLYQKTKRHYSKKHMMSLCDQLQTDCVIDLETHELERYQNTLYCMEKVNYFEQEFEWIDFKEYKRFSFQKTGKTIQGITLTQQDFPIKVRSVLQSDSIDLRYGTKKVSRFFIDRKICRLYRKRWLCVENRDRKVIFVPEIGCDTKHFSAKPSVFMLQYLL